MWVYSSINFFFFFFFFQDSDEILWDLEIKTTSKITINQSDAALKLQKEQKRQLIVIAISQDHNAALKED